MPCPFTGPKMLSGGPNILSQPKNLTAFSASSKTFKLAQKHSKYRPQYSLSNSFILGH